MGWLLYSANGCKKSALMEFAFFIFFSFYDIVILFPEFFKDLVKNSAKTFFIP